MTEVCFLVLARRYGFEFRKLVFSKISQKLTLKYTDNVLGSLSFPIWVSAAQINGLSLPVSYLWKSG